MFAVRYLALATLVIWLGGTAFLLARTVSGDLFAQFPLIGAGAGAIILVSLFVMKFIGPPPHAFALRAAIAFTIMAIGLYSSLFHQPVLPLTAINGALGMVLLFWYARE